MGNATHPRVQTQPHYVFVQDFVIVRKSLNSWRLSQDEVVAKCNQKQKPVAIRPWGPQICSTHGEQAPGATEPEGAGRPSRTGRAPTPHNCRVRAGSPAPVSSGRGTLFLLVLDVVFPWPRTVVPSRACANQVSARCPGRPLLTSGFSLCTCLNTLFRVPQPATQVSSDPPSVSPASAWLLLGRPSLRCPQGREGQAPSLFA